MRDADTRLIAHTLPYPIARAVCAMDTEAERGGELVLTPSRLPELTRERARPSRNPMEPCERTHG
jgi:hypothetical protein